jgi:PAS domain S-box-containing protein
MWIDPSDLGEITAMLAGGRRIASHEVRFRTKSGLVATALYSADIVTIGDEPCVLAIAEDITLRREVEAAHRAILKALPDWVFLLDNDGVFLDFHARDRRHLLAPPEVFLGRQIREVLPAELADGLAACFAEARRTGDPVVYEYSVPFDGAIRFYEARVVQSDSDKLLSIVRDITERKRAEIEAGALRDELAHLGRVTSLEALTGSLAHEINQPLAAVMANADTGLRLISRQPPDLSEISRTLHGIIEESQRAGDVLQRVRSLLRKESTRYESVDLNQTIREVVRLVRGMAESRRIALDVDLSPAGNFVLGDRVQLQQVALNLLLNAFDAVEAREPEARRVILRTTAHDDQVFINVIDQGVGLTDAGLSRMFEPFYTTKRDGMGLGLSICQAIVSAHGGTLKAERNPDRGMTLSAVFPSLTPEDLVGA